MNAEAAGTAPEDPAGYAKHLTMPQATAVPRPRRSDRPRIRIVRNLRALVAAPAHSPRCQADARRVAARLTHLRRVNPLPSPTQPVLIVPPGAADRALGADADVLYICTHSYPGPDPEGLLDTDLESLNSPLTAKALILDTCWGAAPPCDVPCPSAATGAARLCRPCPLRPPRPRRPTAGSPPHRPPYRPVASASRRREGHRPDNRRNGRAHPTRLGTLADPLRPWDPHHPVAADAVASVTR
jgi:hypothetical protein